MALPITELVTTANAQAYKSASTSSTKVKVLKSGSSFSIAAVKYISGVLWVRSGAGDWYQWKKDLFRYAGTAQWGGMSSIFVEFEVVSSQGRLWGRKAQGNVKLVHHSWSLSGAV